MKRNETLAVHSFAVNKNEKFTLVDGSEGGDSCGTAQNVRRGQQRKSVRLIAVNRTLFAFCPYFFNFR